MQKELYEQSVPLSGKRFDVSSVRYEGGERNP